MPAFNNRKGRQMTINELIEKLVGKPFEIECSEIQVHGMLDHHPPIFRGPGVIRSEAEGRITFRMHNQIEATPEALSSLRWFKKAGGGLEPTSHVRIFAEDYDGISWTGAWSIPQTHRSSGSQSVIAGSFNQLSTRIPKSDEDTKI